jgi:pimeloyl-ACP methyl ester carboxylesterase
LPRFEQQFTVYAMDRRGRGGSGDSPDYDIMREAEDVAAVAEAAFQQTGAPVAVLGHSYGALCSLEAALLTDNLSRLILYEPPLPTGLPMYAPDFPGRMKALVDKGQFESALETFFREEVKMPEHELAVSRQLPMWKERIKIVPTILREMRLTDLPFNAKVRWLPVPTLLLGAIPIHFRRGMRSLTRRCPTVESSSAGSSTSPWTPTLSCS